MKNLIPFREFHLLQLLDSFSEQTLPIDLFVSHYFREHKALGSNDRAYIAETLYSLIRWQGLLDHLCDGSNSWEKRFAMHQQIDLQAIRQDTTIPLHTRLSFPKELFDLFVNSHGEEKAAELCLASNEPAPTAIRINPLKTTRDDLMKKWTADQYEVSACLHSEYGIVFHKKINFFNLNEFKEGLFEVQDEGSQLLSQLIQLQPKQHVMDFCSGSGGKTLAFAHQLNGTGQIYLHDIRPRILLEARKRLKRAGIQNVQTVIAGDDRLKKMKKRMDWILVDAPCSGTGTLRRNPDMKWKFSTETLMRLVGQQRTIFEQALSYLKPEGHIVYATCSILKEENQDQIAHFIKTYDLTVVGDPFSSLPAPKQMDGFFGVVLKRNRN